MSGSPHLVAATAINFACKEKVFHFTAFTASFLAWTTGPLHIKIFLKLNFSQV
ncbi:MAG: hypothetical protein LBQ59_05170 [Candidatus Peribacteria bacterium]|nr:hypothetical protein [Candidatus Peribacteria bacterium]